MKTFRRKRSPSFFLILFVGFALVFPAGLRARGLRMASHPIFVSATGGVFRISAEHFSHYYASPWGFFPGIRAGVGLSPSAFLVFEGARFQKSGTGSATWKQTQLEFGFRKYSAGFSPESRTYMGFGLAFFHVRESTGEFLRELGQKSGEAWPKGFFIEIGYEQSLIPHLFFLLHFGLSSAGMYSGSTLQRQSLGGFSASSGLKIQFF